MFNPRQRGYPARNLAGNRRRARARTQLLMLGSVACLNASGLPGGTGMAADLALPDRIQGSALPTPLRVASLNIAHGRNSSINQIFLREATIRGNLRGVAQLLARAAPDVVALQEADGPSWWSGNFDHVAFVASAAGYPWHTLAPHAGSWMYEYGTALLSRAPFVEVVRHDFQSSPPTTTKGFVVARITLEAEDDQRPTVDVDLVSVHLDFSRESVRRSQVEEMNRVLAHRHQPLIVLGDFNSDWASETSAVRRFADLRGLHAYRPDADDLGTYDAGADRLDWILLSPELEFMRYEVLPDAVSDHQIVLAEIRLRPESPDGSPHDSVPHEEAP